MIRFGLLGCGRIARRHADLLGGRHIDRAGLVAVCDPVRPRADAIASKFGVPAHYELDDFLSRKDVDAVAVLTPSGMHPEHVIACARAGLAAKAIAKASARDSFLMWRASGSCAEFASLGPSYGLTAGKCHPGFHRPALLPE